ncbi:histidine phosphatase family protein [Nocardia sp. NPDC024068]|uniref:histidine phosphatase family protein n=1 Tax=Nocardia sp. NPDC024068 TaxID=3157197 RepID=UPI0033D5B65A
MPGVRKLELISHGVTEALRVARFPSDEPLTPAGRAALAERAVEPPANARVLAGPERRTRETAEVLGLAAAPLSRLRDLDAGAWCGAQLRDVAPGEMSRWLTEPGYRGHGGESVLDLRERVGGWLGDLARDPVTTTIAVTHPAVVRAALILVLDAAPESFWRIDVAPGSRVRFHHRGAWTLRLT